MKKVKPFQDLPLWPEGRAPFSIPEDAENRERVLDDTDEIERLTDVSRPTLTFHPATGKGPRPAVLICPGGGYNILAWNHEGTDIAAWLNANGISAFLLKYRCPGRRAAAKADAVRAMRLIRSRAGELNLLADKIGILGFSAGGHLAARVCNPGPEAVYPPLDGADALDARPDFAFLIYPAYLKAEGWTTDPELAISDKTPPTFLTQAENDKPHIGSGLAYYIALEQAGVPAEMHVFATGGHGYGMLRRGNPTDVWPALAVRWFATGVMQSETW